MKITGPKGPKSTSGTKKSSSQGGADGVDFSSFVKSEAPEEARTEATQSIAQLDALLAVQAAEDPTQKAAKKRSILRADALLDKLEEVRLKMLCGDLTVGHMIDVADVVASHRERIDDPQLTSLIDEIDLRAQVELAKMRVAMDAANS